MKIKFWGVRGSIPTPTTTRQVKDKIRRILNKIPKDILSEPMQLELYINNLSDIESGVIGGNTACVELRTDDKIFIFDMGSGLRRLGNELMQNDPDKEGLDLHIFMSHTHWDHIMGLPFFAPAFFPQNKITFYSPHPNLHERLEFQQDFRFFPVSLDKMSSKKEFVQLERETEIKVGGVKIKNLPLHHPGGSFGYRVSHKGKIFNYATDSEYKDFSEEATQKQIDFIKDSDLLIFDAQYTFEEAIRKEDWGHSSALVGIDLSVKAGVKRLALFHHEPERDDFEVENILKKSINYKKINYPDSDLDVMLAIEDLEIEL